MTYCSQSGFFFIFGFRCHIDVYCAWLYWSRTRPSPRELDVIDTTVTVFEATDPEVMRLSRRTNDMTITTMRAIISGTALGVSEREEFCWHQLAFTSLFHDPDLSRTPGITSAKGGGGGGSRGRGLRPWGRRCSLCSLHGRYASSGVILGRVPVYNKAWKS